LGAPVSRAWDQPLRLHEVARGPVQVRLEPDAGQRGAIAARLGLESLPALTADLVVRPWLDGAEVSGRFDAMVEQVCGVSLEPFEQPVTGQVSVRAVPAGSPHAPTADASELELDPDADDPPDVLEGDALDLAAYIVEHLALELDPFPRKPGVAFDYAPPAEEASPFAALKALKKDKS
jgi:uncharacterized metal-binding protein YceD (DUF177 family)